jgi:DDE superfamily endonuclease
VSRNTSVERAKQEIDYGRRGKGYIFGAFQPATGEAFTQDYARRTIANWVDFLEQVDQQFAPESERVYAILDNLSTHHADDVLLFSVRHPRLRVRLPAQVRSLLESHRTLVEGAALAGPQRSSLARPGKSSPRQSKRRPSIGLPTSIPLSGAADDGIDRAASPVLASSQPGFERAGVSGIRLARRPKVPPRHEARAPTCS